MSNKNRYVKENKALYTEKAEEPIVIEPLEPTIGVVTNCSRLNIRRKPDVNSGVVCVVNALSELMIEESQSTVDWYRVCTESGMEGYCMKKFVSTKE